MDESTLNLTIKLLPFVVGTAVVPSLVILVILLLQSNQGLFKAGAFIGGMISWRLFLVTTFVYYAYLFNILFELQIPERINFVILSLIGIILLIVALTVQRKKNTSKNESQKITEIADRINPPFSLHIGCCFNGNWYQALCLHGKCDA
jgi:putative Mn2+ efflux pump MntP